LHDGNSCPDTFTQEEEDERQRQYEEQKQQYYDRMKAAEDARKEARYLERQRHIEELKAQYMKNDLPVPDDVWDFRNFTNLEWWKLKSQERVTAEFLLRAIDVPDEIDPFAGFGLFRKLLSPKQAKTHLLSDYTKEFVKHEKHNLSLIIPTPVRKWIINKALDQAIDSAWSELGDQVTELANRMSENDEKYSPRQFWPANPF
jgi:chromosomal replication initiation ATPase DnaA